MCVEGGRISDCWCMCVVCHGYGGLGGDRDRIGGRVCMWGVAKGVYRMLGDSRVFSECDVKRPDHTAIQVRSSG